MDLEYFDQKNWLSYEYIANYESTGGNNSTQLDIPNGGTYRFNIPDKNGIYLLEQSYLQWIAKIENDADAAISTGIVAIQNNGWCPFESAKLKINDKIVEEIDAIGICAQVHGLVNYSHDYEIGQGSASLWMPDRGSGSLTYPQPLFLTLGRNGGASSLTERIEFDTGVVTVTGGTATQAIDIYSNEVRVRVDKYSSAGVLVTSDIQLTTATEPTNVNYIGIVENDIIRLFVDNDEIKLIDGAGKPVEIYANATSVLAVRYSGVAATDQADVNGMYRYSDCSNDNSGYDQRRRRGVVEGGLSTDRYLGCKLNLRDLFGFLRENPMFIQGATYKIELTRNSTLENIFYCDPIAAALNPQLKFQRMIWWTPKVVFEQSLETRFLMDLNQEKTLEWYSYRHDRSDSLGSGTSGSRRVTTATRMPRRVYVFFQKTGKVDSYEGNFSIFDNMDLTDLYVKINGNKYPEYDYELSYDYSTMDYERAYSDYLKACGIQMSMDCTPAVSYEEFRDLYPLYCIDITPRDGKLYGASGSYDISVHWKFASAPGVDYYVTTIWEEENYARFKFTDNILSKLTVDRT